MCDMSNNDLLLVRPAGFKVTGYATQPRISTLPNLVVADAKAKDWNTGPIRGSIPSRNQLMGHHARSKVRDTHVYYSCLKPSSQENRSMRNRKNSQTMRWYPKLQQWSPRGLHNPGSRWWGEGGAPAPACFELFLGSLPGWYLFCRDPRSLARWPRWFGPSKWKGILVKILVQQSYFKSGERINTKGEWQ